MEKLLTLRTNGNPKDIKGLDSTVGAIVDAKNNLICLVPLGFMDWVYECLTAKDRAHELFNALSNLTADRVEPCGCTRGSSEPVDQACKNKRRTIPFDSPRHKHRRAVRKSSK